MLSFLCLYVLEDVAVRQSLLTDWLVTVSPSRTNRLSQRFLAKVPLSLTLFVRSRRRSQESITTDTQIVAAVGLVAMAFAILLWLLPRSGSSGTGRPVPTPRTIGTNRLAKQCLQEALRLDQLQLV